MAHSGRKPSAQGCPFLGGKADTACCTASVKSSFRESGDGCVFGMLSFWLQKSPALYFAKKCEILPTFQRSFSNWECAGSNPPRSANQSGTWRFYP
jgi:hypothetical protein